MCATGWASTAPAAAWTSRPTVLRRSPWRSPRRSAATSTTAQWRPMAPPGRRRSSAISSEAYSLAGRHSEVLEHVVHERRTLSLGLHRRRLEARVDRVGRANDSAFLELLRRP